MRLRRKRATLAPVLEALEAKTLLSIGINLDSNPAWMNNEMWVDLRNTFDVWQALPGGTTPALTADGYPTSDAQSLSYMLDYPSGVYHLSWRGTATVSLTGKGARLGPVTVGSNGVSRADASINPDLNGLLYLKVTGLNPSHPFDDFHMIAPGYAADTTQIFQAGFLQRLQPFSVLRTSDFTATNYTTASDWSARPTPQDWLQTQYGTPGNGGVAWEYIIDLANQLDKDVWISVPDNASDDYVDHLAKLFHDQLRPDVKLYVEYSNEVWNTAAAPYQRVRADALANPLLTATDPYQRTGQQTAFRLKQISDIFRRDFGSRADQLLPIFAGQAGGPAFAMAGLSFINATYGDPSQYFAGLGIAPYVGIMPADHQPGLSMSSLFSSMQTYLKTYDLPEIKSNAALAAQYHLELVGYEGGQGLRPRYSSNTDLMIDAQNNAEMGTIYLQLWQAWKQATNGPLLLYDLARSYDNFGSWGLLPSLNSPGSVKWDRVMSFTQPTGDATLDGVVDYADFQVLKANFGTTGKWWQQGDFNRDNKVDLADLDSIRFHLTSVQPAQAVEIAMFQAPTVVIAGQPVTLDRYAHPAGLQYSWSASYGGQSVARGSGGSFTFTPATSGDYVVNLTVHDYFGHSSSQTITIDAVATSGAAIFQDSFDTTTQSTAWTAGNSWVQSGGVLSQTSTAPGNGGPIKAILTDQTYPANATIMAKVRVDGWASGPAARVGVSLNTDPTTGQGYDLVFHGPNQVQFLDGTQAGNSYDFNWSPGTWYWFALSSQDGTLYGKVWQDGTPEPKTWMFTQAGWTDRPTGAPALLGGQSDGQSYAKASFDNVVVNGSADPVGLRAAAASSRQVSLAWDAVAGAVGYVIDRRPTGTGTWTKIGTTTGATTFLDNSASSETAYDYRVRARNSIGQLAVIENLATVATPIGALLFADDFSSSAVSPSWTAGSTWTQQGGAYWQNSIAKGGPYKAILTDRTYPSDVTIMARVFVAVRASGAAARVGLSLNTDPATGQGYDLALYGSNLIKFLDGNTPGNGVNFPWEPGIWYWMKLTIQGGTLYGKVWQDGTPEPSNWMIKQAGWTNHPTGAPALLGGQSDGSSSYSKGEFDNVQVFGN